MDIEIVVFAGMGEHDRKTFPKPRIAAFYDIGQYFIRVVPRFGLQERKSQLPDFFQ